MPTDPNRPAVPTDTDDPEQTDLLFAGPGPGEPPGDPLADPAAPPPAAVGRYQVDRELARGGMGAILAARDPVLGRDVAIKVLLDVHARKPGHREQFLEEARITGTLQHPGIVPVYEVGELPDGRPFFAMSLIAGSTLDAQLAARADPCDNLPYFLQAFVRVCEATAYAHASRVIHCDLKPSNVMVAPFGVVKVMDWGLARGPGGTPSYLSPEQANAAPLDERTDVFGLGGILCAILTGQPVYLEKSARRALAHAARADLAETFARLTAAPAPRELVALTKRCLAPHPADRPRDAREVTAALAAYLESDLRRAERDLIRFFELTPDLLCLADVNGRFTRVNGNFTRVLGYPAEELVARPFVEFVHPDDRAVTMAETEKLARGLPVVQFRNRYRDVNGRYRWFEWAARSIPEENVVFAVARDITERMELERRLNSETDPGAAS